MKERSDLPLVSVVIPTYNCEPYIRQTIEAVLAQTYPNVELIVVDDGSSDATVDLVRAFGAAVTLIEQSNQRVCRARNNGFARSNGEFVCFLDHDDYWYPWKLARQVEAFARHPEAGAVFTAFDWWHPQPGTRSAYPAPTTFDHGTEKPQTEVPEYSGWIYHQFLLDCWALTSTVMMRRAVFASSGGFDPELPYSEDWDLWLRISQQHPFVMLDGVSTLYRQSPAQGSRTVRGIDYRTRLLLRARAKWGLASRDGRHLTAAEFNRNIARYHKEFAMFQLRHGDRRLGAASMGEAWRAHPGKLVYGAAWLAASLGWTPRDRGVLAEQGASSR